MRLLPFVVLCFSLFTPPLWASTAESSVQDAAAKVEAANQNLETALNEVKDEPLPAQIQALAQEVQMLFEDAKRLTGDNLTIVQVAWYDKNGKLREYLDSKINAKISPSLAEKIKPLLDKQVEYIDLALKKSKNEIEKMTQQVEEASKEQRLLLQIGLNEAKDFEVIMYQQQYQNYQWQEILGADLTVQKKKLVSDLTNLGKFTAAALHFSRLRQQTLQTQIDSLPADQIAQFQLDLIYRQRNMDSASKRLKRIIDISDPMGIDTVDLKNQLFAATGQLTHELLNWQVFKLSAAEYLLKVKRWVINNLPTVLFNILIFCSLMLVVRFLARTIQKGIGNMVTNSHLKMSQLMQNFVTSMSSKIIYCVGLLFALAQIGLDLTPVLAGMGVAGIVIGFALQDTLSNFASGMMLLIYRPFDVGDWVFAGGVEGKVSKVSLVNTTIRTFSNEVLIIPNSKIWGDVIINRTYERVRRVDLLFGVAYSDPIEKVERILKEVVEADERVLRSPEYIIALDTLGDSSVNFIVRPWVRTDDYMDVMREMTREVKMRFDAEGINIPFPQQDVHLHLADDSKELVIKNKQSSAQEAG